MMIIPSNQALTGSTSMSTVALRQINRESAAESPTSVPAARRLTSRRTLVVLGLALAVAAGGVGVILAPRSSETTDDAYVGADATTVAPKVRGLVAMVLVKDNQIVRA